MSDAVDHWQNVIRPTLNPKERAKTTETPDQALERLKAEASTSVEIGKELAVKLFAMRQDYQARAAA